MKYHWFQRKAIFYVPCSLMGWLVMALALMLAVYRFIQIDSHSHSASDTLINFAFNGLIIAAAYSLIGFLTEKKA